MQNLSSNLDEKTITAQKAVNDESRWVRFPEPKFTVQIHLTHNSKYGMRAYVRLDDIPAEYHAHIGRCADGSGCPAPTNEANACFFEGADSSTKCTSLE